MEKTKTILLVDDDQDYLYQKKIELEEEGFNVVTADSKIKAHQEFEKHKPDIAIVDLMMEDLDTGFVLSYEMKKKNPKMPIIMVSGVRSQTGLNFDSITEEEKEWIKADSIFSKPIRIEQLISEIKRLIKN